MYTEQKKLLIMNILDIFKRYTDENHRLSQKDISDILKNEYDMVADRKAIRRNIETLIDYGYEILYSKKVRMIPVKDPKTKEYVIDPKTNERVMEESNIWYDFYLKREFSDGELRWLIDGIMFSRNVAYNHSEDLIKKLKALSNIYFKPGIDNISRVRYDKGDNQDLFLNIEILDEAIRKNRKVSFRYIEYGTDKKAHVKKRPDGTVREYIISPYQMAANEGKYYLICNYDKYDDISNYRVDRIKDVKILDESAKPFESLKWSNGNRIDIAEYMNEHIYMYSSGSVRVKFRINRPMITDMIDFFGRNVNFSDEDENGVTVMVKTNEASIKQFAKSFAPDVEILEPLELRNQVKEELESALKAYK